MDIKHLLIRGIIAFFAPLCHSDNHYCVRGIASDIELDLKSHRDETIISPVINTTCKWSIGIGMSETDPVQIVMLGIPAAGGVVQGPEISRLVVTGPSGLTANVSSGMIHPLSLAKGNRLLVTSERDSTSRVRSPVNLRIMIPYPGFCSRDMLSFNGSCHAVSPVRTEVKDAIGNCGGSAQLASFISMSQVNSFIAANEARRDVHPYRRALDLSQAVRLGMFYSATDATILSVVRNESGCVLQAIERPEEMLATAAPVTGACGSLRVDESGRAVMEFGDCSKPMLSLISFPETASSTAASHCGSRNRQAFPSVICQSPR